MIKWNDFDDERRKQLEDKKMITNMRKIQYKIEHLNVMINKKDHDTEIFGLQLHLYHQYVVFSGNC